MTETIMRWSVDDLELIPDDFLRFELVDGELFVSRDPHPDHQRLLMELMRPLESWNCATRSGRLYFSIGIEFSRYDLVLPDLVWASHARWARIVGPQGWPVAAPELLAEALQPEHDAWRDREVKRKLYLAYGVDEYWIADLQAQSIEVYRRHDGQLVLVATLGPGDTLTSPLLPGFARAVAQVFAESLPHS